MVSFQSARFRMTCLYSLLMAALVCGGTAATAAGPAPSGQAVMAWHVTISTSRTWSFKVCAPVPA